MHALYTGQLIGLAQDQEIEGANELIGLISQAQGKLADLVAKHFDVCHGTTEFDLGEMCSCFGPKKKGQECPPHIGELDEGSDWVNVPEDVDPLIPMVVIYKPKNAQLLSVPLAFRCCARDGDEAERFLKSNMNEPVEVLWVGETDDVACAFDSYGRVDHDSPEGSDRILSTSAINDVYEYSFSFEDQERGHEPAKGTLAVMPHGLTVSVTGYTDSASNDDKGELFGLTLVKGKLLLTVFANVNQEEPTHIISLETARNSNRHIFRPVQR